MEFSDSLGAEVRSLVQAPLDQVVEHPSQERIRDLLRPHIHRDGHQGFFIIDRNNNAIASMRDRNIGSQCVVSQDPRFADIWTGRSFVTHPMVSDVPLKGPDGLLADHVPTMFVVSPILSDGGDDIVAALAFRLSPLQGYEEIFTSARVGVSGETYGFDRNGLILSASRFEDELRQIGLLAPSHSSMLAFFGH